MTDARVLRPAVDAGGLPGRTGLMVARDERRYPLFAAVVAVGKHVRGEPNDVTLEHATLIERLRPGASDVSEEAAWVAGRSTSGEPVADAATRGALAELVAHSSGSAHVEAVFSAALLDPAQVDRSCELLGTLLRASTASGYVGYIAAARLAQLGSAEGYPVLHRELHDADDAHGRLMAARELAAFLPYDGQTVGDVQIDLLGELTARLTDEDELGASEAPDLLLESGLPGAREAVERATRKGYAKPVREAAKLALDWFDQAAQA